MCTACRKVRLVNVEGDQEEFADLIGTEGDLHLHPTSASSELNWFNPEGRGDSLGLSRKRVTEGNGKVKVFTKLGNCFTFRLLETK